MQTISEIFYSKPQRKTFIMKIIEGLKVKKEFVNILHFFEEYDLFVFIFRGKLIHIKSEDFEFFYIKYFSYKY